MLTSVGVALAVIGLACGAASASGSSRYSSLDLDRCALVQGDDMGGVFRCDGPRGTPLFIKEGDLRFSVDIGQRGDGFISIAPFNTLGETAEWRYGPDGRLRAVIVRYRYEPPPGIEMPSELAVIAAPGESRAASCYVAFVPPGGPAPQNVAARSIADTIADRPCIVAR